MVIISWSFDHRVMLMNFDTLAPKWPAGWSPLNWWSLEIWWSTGYCISFCQWHSRAHHCRQNHVISWLQSWLISAEVGAWWMYRDPEPSPWWQACITRRRYSQGDTVEIHCKLGFQFLKPNREHSEHYLVLQVLRCRLTGGEYLSR